MGPRAKHRPDYDYYENYYDDHHDENEYDDDHDENDYDHHYDENDYDEHDGGGGDDGNDDDACSPELILQDYSNPTKAIHSCSFNQSESVVIRPFLRSPGGTYLKYTMPPSIL